MKKIHFAALLMLLSFLETSAQQDPNYTQYMYNMSAINPAYAGSKENMTGGLLYRKQWVGLDGAPSTGTFFLNTPVGKNVGVGLSLVSDKIGPVEENNISGDFSYTLNLGGERRLALGLKAGLALHKADFSLVIPTLPDPNDEAWLANPSTKFNVGTGLFYYTNKYYVAFSLPSMLKTTYLDYNGTKYGSEISHYFLTGGYVFDINPTLKFKPFTMIKTAAGAPTSFDLSTNFLFNDKFEAGATYRFQDSFGFMVNYLITPNLRLGYAYDHVVSDLKVVTPSSHEFIMLFDLNFPKKVSQSPRYF
ncbi:MAG: type IX secretion system membrane protein PorP/SprF [Flavobacterium psychrophilum]